MSINSQVNIIGEGFVTLQFSLKDRKYKDIILNDVAYVSNATLNLFSVKVAAEKEVRLNTITDELIWVADKLIVKYAARYNKLYSIQLQQTEIAATAISHWVLYNTWHHHLAYIGIDSLVKLSKTVTEIHLRLSKPHDWHVCDSCIKVKQHCQISRWL